MIHRHLLRSTPAPVLASIIAGICSILSHSRNLAAPPATSTQAASALASRNAPSSPSLLGSSSLLESGIPPKYPWKTNIVATVFWVGELPTQNNPVPNTASSWDPKWMNTFGGYDDPDISARHANYRPANFVPKENPFYVALPYNDCINYKTTKPEAAKMIPWFKEVFVREGKSVCHNRWIAIRYNDRICYAQWSDCGPFVTTDADYVFGSARPVNTKNNGAGIDLAPAVRDYLGIRSGKICDWRFVEEDEVPGGPWKDYGKNNPFSLDADKVASMPSYAAAKAGTDASNGSTRTRTENVSTSSESDRLEELRRQRDLWFRQNGSSNRAR
jgi:hypothetical protein